MAVAKSVSDNLQYLKDLIQDETSLVTGRIDLPNGRLTAGVVYLKGLANEELISSQIVRRLTECISKENTRRPLQWQDYIKSWKNGLITNLSIKETSLMDELTEAVLDGKTALFLEGSDTALIVDTTDAPKRQVATPEVEVNLLGSKEAFIEDVVTNKALIRRRLASSFLRFRLFRLGRLSRTKVYVTWLEDIANPKIVEEVFRRLDRIDVDHIYSSGLISELIGDNPLSLWPEYKTSELPDVVASNITEGRIAILCDGFSLAIIVPYLILQEMQTPDDYGQKALTASILRVLRYLAPLISMLLTPLYLSFVAYNHTIIPPNLATHIAQGRAAVPFPSAVEVIIMTVVIDLLREAGLRLPKGLGSAIGILGAVVIGQAAVDAGYVSPAVIIIIAIAAISTFIIPSYMLAVNIRMVNYVLILLASVSGFFGVIIGAVFFWVQIISLRSFGIPLSYPVSTGFFSSLRDILVRVPPGWNKKRPEILAHGNETRMAEKTAKPDKGQRKRERKK